MSSRGGKLAPEVNSYTVTPEELFDLFGKFGPIRQVRQGISGATKGTAFVVYEDVMDAKQACDKLNGFNFQNRYLVDRPVDSPKDNTPPKSSGRSLSPRTPASRDPKTILRNGRLSAGAMPKRHASARAVHFVEGQPAALRSCA
ncbi:pre-mRNA branch site protein p14 [Moelleriella libera RCEF 2490]|uniref:Pre-mRNA branch site protein p14 n=1 Tax=Moelleriella libera RCEF 2490 TaxID=1081109 RepID=A0A166UV62_9HYPO|nr:pre-mRNA branch site protein p14 [Moelleriella libera RCEF 2490]